MVSYQDMSDKEIEEYRRKSIKEGNEKSKLWAERRKTAGNNGNTKDIRYCNTGLFKN